MKRIPKRQPAPSHAQLALVVRAGSFGAQQAFDELEARFRWLRRHVFYRAQTDEQAAELVRDALSDTIVGPPEMDAQWPNAVFADHVRKRANKMANGAVANRDGLPVDFVEARAAIQRVIDRLKRSLGRLPSVDEVLADPEVAARKKPVPPAHVAWLLDEQGSRTVRFDTSEQAFDEIVGAMPGDQYHVQMSLDACLEWALICGYVRLFVQLLLVGEGYGFEKIAAIVRHPEPPVFHDRFDNDLTWRELAAEWPGLPASWETVCALYRKPDGTFIGAAAIRKAHRNDFDTLARSAPDAGFFVHLPHGAPQEKGALRSIDGLNPARRRGSRSCSDALCFAFCRRPDVCVLASPCRPRLRLHAGERHAAARPRPRPHPHRGAERYRAGLPRCTS